MRRFFVWFLALPLFVAPSSGAVSPAAASTLSMSGVFEGSPLPGLALKLRRLAERAPGVVAISVVDLNNGSALSINGDRSLPAASTIKVAVMVEVFRQIATGKFTLERTVSVFDRDRDCGFGLMCDARWGSQHTVRQLLAGMIDASDNTATNMLIRLVGRRSVNQTMADLGLDRTKLGDVIHSDGDIRALRTSADDMVQLLAMIARREIVSDWACDQMLAILARQRHNKYLPRPLPRGLVIEHKTGTLNDTVNDVGIVELEGAPYVISVFTTRLADLDAGKWVIRQASRLTYEAFSASLNM